MFETAAIPLAIWGPQASGKTVLMAQLHLESHSEPGEWDVYPTQQASLAFIQQMQERRLNNEFPPFTTVGYKEQIAYAFVHRTSGIKASLIVEDRAGQDYESLVEDARARLQAAAGLVLLIDHTREQRHIQAQLSRLLYQMHLDRPNGGPSKDPRPIAVCLSKADSLVETAADYVRARQEPDAFVRDLDRWDLAPTLDRFCANYRFFPVSAVGVAVTHGVVEPNTFYDENFNLRVKTKGQPFNLMAPFAWLIGQLTASP